jgi:alkyldihydroxyacetonephosphate synthase
LSAEPAAMRWWGWGDPGRSASLAPRALELVREELGASAPPQPPVALERVRLDPPAIAPATLAQLRDIVGAESLRDDAVDRVVHAAGKGYPDLVRLRAGEPQGAPDAIAYPASREQLTALLGLCAEHSLAVVPFGGGTSVVGGVAPLRGEHSAVLTLDLRRLAHVARIDERSRKITVGAGMRAAALERLLAPRSLTLGHFPQSFEYVTLGGCAATRSAGQASTGYGRFERMVLGLRLCSPSGVLGTSAVPASAAGPDLRALIVGSEGTLGVIDQLTLRLRPRPPAQHYEGAFFEDFEQGMEAMRELAQERIAPEVARLSDAPETRLSLALSSHGGLFERVGRAYLRARGMQPGCLAIFGFEGEAGGISRRRRIAHSVVRARHGLLVGEAPGRAWHAARFGAPHLRDELLTHGVLVETLETATSWSGLSALHRAVGTAIAESLRSLGTPGIVGCHVSHIYETGASLYFTLLAPQLPGRKIEQWQAVKQAAGDAICAHGATITHHHAVGRDHSRWMEREIGSEGLAVLRALKRELDPSAIMNPGKLIG